MPEIKPKTKLEKIIKNNIMSFDFSGCDKEIREPMIKRQNQLNKGRLPNFYTNHWSKRTPPSLSSLASNHDGDEAKNFYALNLCWENGVDPKIFSKRPTKEQILKHKKIDL